MGCLLTKTDIFKKIKPPWFETNNDKNTSDMVFAKKLRNIGVQLYADSHVLCEQIDESNPAVYNFDTYKKWLDNPDNIKGRFMNAGIK